MCSKGLFAIFNKLKISVNGCKIKKYLKLFRKLRLTRFIRCVNKQQKGLKLQR